MFVSRFKDGKLVDGDFSGLEFRVAGELSGDQQILEDVLNGKDVHRQTGSIIFQKDAADVTKDERQDSKEFTFAPLFGGMGMSYPEYIQAYFREFMNIYEGVAEWHNALQAEAIKYKRVRLPTGREFAFPTARRTQHGGSTGATRIKNYPVQSFATADIVPTTIIRLHKEMVARGLRAKLVLTVHDSVVVDAPEDEVDEVAELMKDMLPRAPEFLKDRYGYEMRMPLACEVKVGNSLFDGKVV